MSEETKYEECQTREERRVPTESLRWVCTPEELDFETTQDVEPLSGIIGQDDAIDALRFGLETFAPGQNVYVRGLTGTGRSTLVRRVLKETQPACALASDYCFVANFAQTTEPRLLTLPRGKAIAFRDELDELIRFLKDDLGPALSSDDMRARRRFLDESYQERIRAVTDPFSKELEAEELVLVSIQVGQSVMPAIVPVLEGEPAPPERLEQLKAQGKLDDAAIEALEEKVAGWSDRLEAFAVELRLLSRDHGREARNLIAKATREIVATQVADLRADFPQEDIGRFLDSVVDEVVHVGAEELTQNPGLLRRFRVNPILAHEENEGCPVIVETTPTLANLLGTVDRRVTVEGGVISDHLMITAGSLLRADGGYLILEAREVLREPGAWKVLLRTLRSGLLEIVPSELSGPWSGRTLKPDPIPLNVKIILIGDPGLYYLLDGQDPDFPHLFKVLADFDSSIARTPENLRAYAGLIARVAEEENLPAFDRTAIAALAEHGARVAGRNDRLSTRFGRLVDIAREAAFLTQKSTRTQVEGQDVIEAIRRGKRRGELPARRFRERIAEGSVHVETDGAAVGQVNGLAVIHAGPLVYGFPARITATIGAGHSGAINIERESQLSGAIHTKGFYILGGLLRHLLQTQHPLAFSASIAFEQSYGGIDGDSASGAEICCLMSALTGIPLRQDLAMTGAIDQHGRIQPIGAATEKIEGFFDACVDLGLTGDQGVIIPQANVRDLMLRQDIVEACREGRFHVFAVETIQQALEIFTGISAGERDNEGEYPEGTLLHTAVERAFEFWSLASARPVWDVEEEVAEAKPGPTEEAASEA